jgi:hypothetical protein
MSESTITIISNYILLTNKQKLHYMQTKEEPSSLLVSMDGWTLKTKKYSLGQNQ